MNRSIRFTSALATLLGAVITTGNVHADEAYKVDFSKLGTIDYAASNAVLNIIDGRLQAPSTPASAGGVPLKFGDGSDGAFSDGPARAPAIIVSGITITFDTDAQSEYAFSSFKLSSGFVLKAKGSKPLVLRVAGTTEIAGTISLDGASGAVNALIGPAAGGLGSAGGGSGGAGGGEGSESVAATAGLPTTGNAIGGGIGNQAVGSTQDEGGGGGCNGVTDPAFPTTNTEDARPGLRNTSTLANHGNCTQSFGQVADSFDLSFRGGSGGGGGGAFTFGGSKVGGAGGGAGGGALHIVSFADIHLTGIISARGGAGGANDEVSTTTYADCGGAGGGGSGGSVWLQTTGNVSGNGVIDLSRGAGGKCTNPFCTDLYDGGQGSRGVVRVDSKAATLSTVPSTTLNAVTLAPATGTYTAVSTPIDFSGVYTDFSAATESRACGDDGKVTVTYEGSNDGTHFAHSVAAKNLHELSPYKFIRFKADIEVSGPNPPCLTGIGLPYSRELSNISLNGGFACGTISSDGRPPRGGGGTLEWIGDLAVLMVALFAGSRNVISTVGKIRPQRYVDLKP